MKKFYSIAMLLMLVVTVSSLTSCNNNDNDNTVNNVNGSGTEVQTKTFTGILKVYDRLSESSEDPNGEITVPVEDMSLNMTLATTTFGLSIEDLVLEITGMGATPPSTLSISDVPYTVSSSDADICEVDYTCNVQIDILGTYANVTKIKGSFSKSSNVMDLAILAVGSDELLGVPVYISAVCPGTAAGE